MDEVVCSHFVHDTESSESMLRSQTAVVAAHSSSEMTDRMLKNPRRIAGSVPRFTSWHGRPARVSGAKEKEIAFAEETSSTSSAVNTGETPVPQQKSFRIRGSGRVWRGGRSRSGDTVSAAVSDAALSEIPAAVRSV